MPIESPRAEGDNATEITTDNVTEMIERNRKR